MPLGEHSPVRLAEGMGTFGGELTSVVNRGDGFLFKESLPVRLAEGMAAFRGELTCGVGRGDGASCVGVRNVRARRTLGIFHDFLDYH